MSILSTACTRNSLTADTNHRQNKKETCSGLQSLFQLQSRGAIKKQNQEKNGSPKKTIMKYLRHQFGSKQYCRDHVTPRAFLRNRKLPFQTVFLLLLRKSVKSMQLVINEFFQKFDTFLQPATSSAFTQARRKFLPTAFIEIMREMNEIFYEESHYLTYRSHRLLSVDGSKIILPNEPEIQRQFGVSKIVNQGNQNLGEYANARCSV